MILIAFLTRSFSRWPIDNYRSVTGDQIELQFDLDQEDGQISMGHSRRVSFSEISVKYSKAKLQKKFPLVQPRIDDTDVLDPEVFRGIRFHLQQPVSFQQVETA